MEQTAVEFLVSHLIEYGFDLSLHRIEIEQAKEMEKKQRGYSEEDLKEAYTEGSFAQLRYIDGLPYIDRDRWFEQLKNK